MPSRLYSFLVNIGVVAILVGGLFLFVYPRLQGADQGYTAQTATSTPQAAAAAEPFGIADSADYHATPVIAATNTPTVAATTSVPKSAKTTLQSAKSTASTATNTGAKSPPSKAASSTAVQINRIQNPYGNEAAQSFGTVNTTARTALVNILCMPRSGGTLAPISGSGIIIDPRGVILTNAHVAQYVLLSESPDINLTCQIRTGNPAKAQWTASVLYIPPVWVSAHASELNTDHPTGTGEHDYALLLVNGALDGGSLPPTFPYLPFDVRDGIGFLGDQVLGASYPAEFLGGLAAENSLFPVSSVSAIDQLLTFGTNTVDVISIGGVVEAQSGSSGGPVVNQWGRLIGIIATTSDAPTTAQRDLRAITMAYIDRDFTAQTGSSLNAFLSGNIPQQAASFTSNIAPGLIQTYITLLTKQQ